MDSDKWKLPKRFPIKTRNIWTDLTDLCDKYKPVNLGIGHTDELLPSEIGDVLVSVAQKRDSFLHQYARGYGHPRLVEAVSNMYEKLTKHKYDPMTEILITNGACEGIYAAIQGFIDTDDEVIVIEPFFDSYEPIIRICGGIPRFIPLRQIVDAGEATTVSLVLDEKELESLFNAKTKMIIINTPNNPTGKVLTRKELEKIAQLCMEWNVICVSDEVYERLVYDGKEHVRMCTVPGMRERTITISSAGKSFSVCGWRIGWAYGPAALIRNLMIVHENTVYSCVTLIQETIAQLLEKEIPKIGTKDSFFYFANRKLERKRNFLVDALQKCGINAIIPEGGIFLIADWTNLERKANLTNKIDKRKDFQFIEWMTKELGVLVVPTSVFYSEEHKDIGERFIRICFHRQDDVLDKTAKLFQKLME